MRSPLTLLAIALFSTVALAAPSPTVAVMPFKDLSGGKGSVGEAIRETVTTDLKDVPGLRVIERSAIDHVLAEQNLQGARSDLDPLSTVKVGKLLGASMIVAGAYQKAASSVRLTARFVKVETGEVVGTAKVDGAAADFLSLQDRVTSELLRSAGIEKKHVLKFAQRARPKLKSLKTVELYGDAVVETDDHKKEGYLKLALDEDPTFVYAAKDLDALEKRLKQYEAGAKAAQEKELQALRDQLAKETDPDKRAQLRLQVWSGLQQTHRYRTLEREARALPDDELAAFYLVVMENLLKERDLVLRDGEAFLKRFPQSLRWKSVESMVKDAIDHKRKIEEGKATVAVELAKLSSSDRWDLCRVARVYNWEQQKTEAQRLFRACLEVGTARRADVLRDLVFNDIELGDWQAARADFAALEKEAPKEAAQVRPAFEVQVPIDG